MKDHICIANNVYIIEKYVKFTDGNSVLNGLYEYRSKALLEKSFLIIQRKKETKISRGKQIYRDEIYRRYNMKNSAIKSQYSYSVYTTEEG